MGVGSLLLALVAPASCTRPSPEPPRHVVLVTIDTLRADHLECYGYPRPTAPFLCGLSEEGALFEQAMSSASHTAPSHASLFTSLQPVQHKVVMNGQRLDGDAWTMAEMFQARGWPTGAFTAVAFLGAVSEGFDFVDARSHEDGAYRTADHVVDSALSWLEERDPDEHLFLWVHLFDVHDARPYIRGNHAARAEVRRRSPLNDEELVNWIGAEHGTPWRFYRLHHLRELVERRGLPRETTKPLEELEGAEFSRAMMALQMDLYDGQILFVDRQINRLFRTMEAAGWMRVPTVWLLTSDHGEGLGEHDSYGHGRFIYQEQLHVPLILWSSEGRWAPRRVPELVRLVDLFPTLAELVGGTLDPQPAPVQGQSLLPLIEGRGKSFHPAAAYAQRRPAREHWEAGEIVALQDERYKYIYHSEGEDELYDLEVDPLEHSNLLDRPDPPNRTEALRDELLAHFGRMAAESRRLVGSEEVDPALLEELRALGYIR